MPGGPVVTPAVTLVPQPCPCPLPADYHAVAEALGGKGFVVGRPDSERLDAVLRAAQDACRRGHPVLVNALIGKTDFREGSISV